MTKAQKALSIIFPLFNICLFLEVEVIFVVFYFSMLVCLRGLKIHKYCFLNAKHINV